MTQQPASPRQLGITVLFLVCLCELSWLLMQAVHELGHVLAAWLSGREVMHVILHPLRISETVIEPRPVPAGIVWAGPVMGSLLPLVAWGSCRILRGRDGLLEACLWFFAGFCLLANGAYLGSAVQVAVGDAFDLVQRGVPIWQLGLFGAVCMGLGLWCWDGLRPRLGLGVDASPIPARAAVIAALVLVVVLTAGFTIM